MGLKHSVHRAYGFEIPTTTDFDHLDQVLADHRDGDRIGGVQHTYLGDFERLFLVTICDTVEPAAAATVTTADFERYEVPAWNKALHDVAVRLGHETHPEPTWLVLHDYS